MTTSAKASGVCSIACSRLSSTACLCSNSAIFFLGRRVERVGVEEVDLALKGRGALCCCCCGGGGA